VGASRRASCARDASCGRRFRARGRDAPYDNGQSLAHSTIDIPGVLGLVRVQPRRGLPKGWHDREETEETRGERGAVDNARNGEYITVLLCLCFDSAADAEVLVLYRVVIVVANVAIAQGGAPAFQRFQLPGRTIIIINKHKYAIDPSLGMRSERVSRFRARRNCSIPDELSTLGQAM